MKDSLGLVHVYTGTGKGKTTAALGLALRALEHGLSVNMIQFLKGGTYTGELLAQERYSAFRIQQFGKGNDEQPRYEDFMPDEQDRKRAQAAMAAAMQALPSTDVLILDEVNVAVQLGHLHEDEVMDLLKARNNTEVILTGRGAVQAFIDEADYVTDMAAVKHPYNKGILGRRGIDY